MRYSRWCKIPPSTGVHGIMEAWGLGSRAEGIRCRSRRAMRLIGALHGTS